MGGGTKEERVEEQNRHACGLCPGKEHSPKQLWDSVHWGHDIITEQVRRNSSLTRLLHTWSANTCSHLLKQFNHSHYTLSPFSRSLVTSSLPSPCSPVTHSLPLPSSSVIYSFPSPCSPVTYTVSSPTLYSHWSSTHDLYLLCSSSALSSTNYLRYLVLLPFCLPSWPLIQTLPASAPTLPDLPFFIHASFSSVQDHSLSHFHAPLVPRFDILTFLSPAYITFMSAWQNLSPLCLWISPSANLNLLTYCLLASSATTGTSHFPSSKSPCQPNSMSWPLSGQPQVLPSSCYLPREPKHPRQPGMPCPPHERPRESPSTVLPNFHGECPTQLSWGVPQHPLPPGLPHLPFEKPRVQPSSGQLSLPGGHSCHHLIALKLY